MEKRVTIRKLERGDVEAMAGWGRHRDPLFSHYNFPELSRSERGLWFRMKTAGFKRRCFAVLDEADQVIGYLSMKNISHFKRRSELGIVLDPGRIGQGYGPAALKAFLKLYFESMKMEKLVLKVARFNDRAFKAYQRCGFEIERELVEAFEEQDIDEAVVRRVMEEIPHIFLKGRQIQCRYLLMSITREQWFSPSEGKSC